MKRILVTAFFLLLGSPAAGAAPLVVEALFISKARIPGVLIPFRVKGDVMAGGGTILSIETKSDNGVDCRTMQDPFANDIIHLKCAAPAKVDIRIRATAGGQFYEITLAALEIKYPVSGVVVVKPPTVDPEILLGRQLFNTYCVACHTDSAAKKGRTANQILSAINAKPQMNFLRGTVNSTEAGKIAKYLGSL